MTRRLSPSEYYMAQRLYRSLDENDGLLAEYIVRCEAGEIDVEAQWKERLPGEFCPKELDAAVQAADSCLAPDKRARELRKMIAKEFKLANLIALKTRYAAVRLLNDSVDSGSSSWNQEILDEVRNDLEWCVAKDPAYWLAHKWLAVALCRIAQLQRNGIYVPKRTIIEAQNPAMFAAKRALLLRPDVLELWDLMARVCAKFEYTPEARKAWKMGCKLRILDCATGLGHMALVYKQKKIAAACFALAKQIDPSWATRNTDYLQQVGDHLVDAADPNSIMKVCHPAEFDSPQEWGLDFCWV